MSIAGSHDCYFVNGDSQTLAVASAAGTVVSTTALGNQTYAIQLVANGIVSSTGGVRVKIAAATDSVVSSTLGAMVPFNFPITYKVNPGQIVMALSNNTGSCTLVVTELTN